MEHLKPIFDFFDHYFYQVLLTIALIVIHTIVKSLFRRAVKKHAFKNDFHYSREIYIRKLINISLMLLLVTIIGAIWEISFQGLSFYFASIFTIIGVALFANWSILSNLTASVIIFFFLPYRVGDTIRVVDGDQSEKGIIRDIGLFQVILLTEDGRRIAYFNNLFLQKPIEYIEGK
jgi:MscS family membrane protein